MDTKSFDALTRRFGAQRNRRDAVKAFAAGIMGLGIAKGASAQVGIEEATCGQDCDVDGDCNAGLRCSEPSGRPGLCVAQFDSEDPCDEDGDCDLNYEVCRNGECVNQSDCQACNDDDGDCPGDQICRNDRCRDEECNSDNDCGGRKVCRDGQCVRDDDECDSNSDCPRRQRCRRGRCVRRR